MWDIPAPSHMFSLMQARIEIKEQEFLVHQQSIQCITHSAVMGNLNLLSC